MDQRAIFNTSTMKKFNKVVGAKNVPEPFLYGGIRVPRKFIMIIRSFNGTERLCLKYKNKIVSFCDEERELENVSFGNIDDTKCIQFLSLFSDHCGFVIDGVKPDIVYQIILDKTKYITKPCSLR